MSGISRGGVEVEAILESRTYTLMKTCPTLSLVVWTASGGISEARYTRTDFGNALIPTLATGVSEDFRFWIPPKEIDVCRNRHNTCCAM